MLPFDGLPGLQAPLPAVVPDPYARPPSLSGLPKDIILYQYEVCPYCCKVKAALDYYKVCWWWAVDGGGGGL